MLFPLKNDQKAFVEITNEKHGGLGWELGTCLWSPVRDGGRSKAWKLMERVNTGDVIIHLVIIKKKYHWYGTSIADSRLIETETEPPMPSKWAGMSPYQRINLTEFNKLDQPPTIQSFFDHHKTQLQEILNDPESTTGQFYCSKIIDEVDNLQMNQRYFAKCPESLYRLFDDFSTQIGFNVVQSQSEFIPTPNEPQNPDYNAPGRIDTIVSRIVRDTKLSRRIKEENNWVCQICRSTIRLPNQSSYNEGHHLQPLGGEHNGPDVKGNIIVLCPTHHVEFDYGCISIDPKSKTIIHLDPLNLHHGKELAYHREDLEFQFLNYHHRKRFQKI